MQILDQVPSFFSSSYAEARSKFLDGCARLDLRIEEYRHPLAGPAAEILATDVAYIGPVDAAKLIIVISGTHGVEGLTGSGCQLAWLETGGVDSVPADTAVLLVHMLNPWGSAWRRRQTENNVDLNRNFHAFGDGALPCNIAYEALQPTIARGEADGAHAYAMFRERDSKEALAQALFAGQYAHDDGVGFGGIAPTWSHLTLNAILEKYAKRAETVALIDIHTGLGPFGYGSLLCPDAPGSENFERALQWYGPGIVSLTDDAMPFQPEGDLMSWVRENLPGSVTSVALEFGTFPLEEAVALQIDDCRLEKSGDIHSGEANALRSRVEGFFFPATPDWLQSVALRAIQILRLAGGGLEKTVGRHSGHN